MRRETTFLAVSPSMRLRIETTVENLLALLDEIEGDENLEDGGDAEPSLGWTRHGAGWAEYRDGPALDDREAEDEHDEDGDPGEDNGDAEPSLGSMGFYANGKLEYDLEADTSDDEPGGDDEPSMGWTEKGGQGPIVGLDPGAMYYESDVDDTGGGSLQFTGEGYAEGRAMLRRHVHQPQRIGDNLTVLRPGMAIVGRS